MSEASSFTKCNWEGGGKGGSRKHLTQRQLQERHWVQVLGRFCDILLMGGVSTKEGREREGNTYIAFVAHPTSRRAILGIRLGTKRVDDNVPNVRAMNAWPVLNHA